MKWPATCNEMYAAGWVYDNDATCRGCGAEIEWWISPAGKKTPVNTLPPENFIRSNLYLRGLHFASCPERDRFRR
jgi:hypothetical protein